MSASSPQERNAGEPQPRVSAFIIMIACLMFLFGLVGRMDRFLPGRSEQDENSAAPESASSEEPDAEAPSRRATAVIGAEVPATAPSPAQDEPQRPGHDRPQEAEGEDATVVPAPPDERSRLSRGGLAARPDRVPARSSAYAPEPQDAESAQRPRIRPRAQPAREPRVYTVRQQDTLWSIARRTYGTGACWQAIVAENPGLKPDELHPGRTIRLPPPERVHAP